MMIRCVQDTDGNWIPLDIIPKSHKAKGQRIDLNQVDFTQGSPILRFINNFKNLPM